jgi:hypothetical protein
MYLRLKYAGESLDGKGFSAGKIITRTDKKLQLHLRGEGIKNPGGDVGIFFHD